MYSLFIIIINIIIIIIILPLNLYKSLTLGE
jgi:hypothetical protein